MTKQQNLRSSRKLDPRFEPSINIMNQAANTSDRPDALATITVRVVKSFSYRTVKNHVFKDLDLSSTTVGQLMQMVKELCATGSAFRAYRNVTLDTVKIYTKAFGHKTMNLVINMDNDEEWILDDFNKTLLECGVEHETELSVFNRNDYEEFKKNPEEKWI